MGKEEPVNVQPIVSSMRAFHFLRLEDESGISGTGTVAPIADFASLRQGDIVLCKVYGHEYLHLIHSVVREGEVWFIANARGRVNGTAGRGCIYGRCIKIE